MNEPKATYGRQVWGHPLYRWQIPMFHRDIVNLFNLRMRYLTQLFDRVRIDHANGFFLYGSIDPNNEANDTNLLGPGSTVFSAITNYCKEIGLDIFAEDAAVELSELRKAMQHLSIPGIRIAKYAYDENKDIFEKDYFAISHYPKETVAYTTTHDTETLMGWMKKLTSGQKKHLAEKMEIIYSDKNEELARILRDAIIHSPSQTIIIQIQDWLLDTKRINVPGTENEKHDPNWQYTIPVSIEALPLIEAAIS
jgi:4-alpha-glucanotransferase